MALAQRIDIGKRERKGIKGTNLPVRIVLDALLLDLQHQLPRLLPYAVVVFLCRAYISVNGVKKGKEKANAPKTSSSIPRHTTSSSPSCTSDSKLQSSASLPLSSGPAAHRKTRVLRVRAYPALLTCSVNENMDATGFSNVSKETLGV
jgi:hypothetical protein